MAVRVKPHRPLGLFSEYWLNPEEMAAQFRGDWYLTGDRATRDADGYFWFIGRKDDVIKSSGYRIGPFEVESALLEHPAVLEVAVIGQPDPLRGQIVKACVVLRPGIEAADELKRELQTHCKTAHRRLQISARDRIRARAAQDHQRQDAARGTQASRSCLSTEERRPHVERA